MRKSICWAEKFHGVASKRALLLGRKLGTFAKLLRKLAVAILPFLELIKYAKGLFLD